jgi:hypothetical protein
LQAVRFAERPLAICRLADDAEAVLLQQVARHTMSTLGGIVAHRPTRRAMRHEG